MLRLAVVIACHNRREHTVRCLQSVVRQPEFEVSIYLMDDGSSDGTADAVLEFPNMHLLRGDGTLFWNRGMHAAFAAAMADKYDGYLWLNDDVSLDPDALLRLREAYDRIRERGDGNLIIVGSTRDPHLGKVTYGGLSRVGRLRPLAFARIDPRQEEIEVDTMNGNFVFIPESTARVVGNLDPGFHHQWGDVDYGLRARSLGVNIWLMQGTIGLCRRGPRLQSWRAPGIRLRERWARMNSPQGIPLFSWLRFARRYGGIFWPFYAAWAYRGLWRPER